MNIFDMTALELGSLIAWRKISAIEAAQGALERMTRLEPGLNAMITISSESALAQAADVQKRLDAGEQLPPLAGVPLVVKDNISTSGIRTTCGSRMLESYQPFYDATVIERIKASGAVILGKANCDEFAMGSTTETSFFGPTRNPFDTNRVPGGSSGGPAAAVAAREAWYALGSDTGGSIRQPCSYCGLTGLKPTYGAVSRYGLVAYASSLDQIGPISRSAADCAAALAMFAGPDPRDSTAMPQGSNLNSDDLLAAIRQPDNLQGMTIGIPDGYYGEGLQPATRNAVMAVADLMAALGARIEHIKMPLIDKAIPAYYLIATAEASANLARYDGIQYGFRPSDGKFDDLYDFYSRARTQGFGREVRRRILLGTFALSSGYYDAYYLKALKARQMVQDAFSGALLSCDMIIAPVAPTTAPRLGESLTDPLKMYLSDVYTVSANLAGLPALALPCGQDEVGLPIGCQLIGPAFSDARLLQTAIFYQSMTAYHRMQPKLEEVPA